MTLRWKSFENIVGKRENAGNKHILLFPHCFLLDLEKEKMLVTSIFFFSHIVFYSIQKVAKTHGCVVKVKGKPKRKTCYLLCVTDKGDNVTNGLMSGISYTMVASAPTHTFLDVLSLVFYRIFFPSHLLLSDIAIVKNNGQL